MNEINNKRNKLLFVLGIIALLLVVMGATYAYFAVTTVNNFGTSTINAQAGNIGTVTLNGNSAQLNMSLTALDMVQGNSDITYYASSSGKTTTPTEEVIGTASVTPSTDTNYYHCTYTLSVTHSGTNDMYTVFSSAANKSAGQIILTINGVDYDFYNGWPTNNQVTGSFNTSVASPANITAGLRLINDSDINQNYLANTDIQISISLVNNSLSCTAVEPVLTYANPSTCNTLTTNCEVIVGGDNFYVVSSDSTNTVLLAKYDLKSDGASSYMQDTSGTSTNLVKPNFLDSSGIFYWDGCLYNGSSCTGSSSGLLSGYANSSNAAGTTSYVSIFPYVYKDNNGNKNAVNIYPIVDSYANKIGSAIGIAVEGRLMSYEEESSLDKSTVSRDMNGYYYWLGSAVGLRNLWYVNTYGTAMIGAVATDNRGVRPVIVINTSDIAS